jgi:hypothetical protein
MIALETQVLRLIGENVSNPDVFLDTDTGLALISKSLNHAIQEVCMVTGNYTKTYMMPLFEGRQFYRLSSTIDHLLYPVLVWDRGRKYKLTQTDLIKVTNDNPSWMQLSGPPVEYMILGMNHVGIIYKPDADGGVLEMTWVCAPMNYTRERDTIKLREVFQRACVYHAVSEFYASRGDAVRATEWFNKYMDTASLGWMIPQPSERQFQFGKGRDKWQGLRAT